LQRELKLPLKPRILFISGAATRHEGLTFEYYFRLSPASPRLWLKSAGLFFEFCGGDFFEIITKQCCL
ncbi:MAG: hypothetical protein AAGU32_20870, partial [Bacillota bacterium]